MKYLAIIQARCGSTRLPNKVLMDLCGKSQIMRVIDRVSKSKYIDKIVVATSITENNLPLIEECSKNGVSVFVGSENNVLDRFYQLAKLYEPKYIIRITADCPLYDAGLLDYAIEEMGDADYIGDLTYSVYPDGADIEVFKFSALKRAWEEAKMSSEMEHVTIYIKNHPDKFKLKSVTAKIKVDKEYRFSVDQIEDFEVVKRIYEHFGEKDFSLKEVLEYVDLNPEIYDINSSIGRNEGLTKSLNEDKKIYD